MAELPVSFLKELADLDLGEDAEASLVGFARRNVWRMDGLAKSAYKSDNRNFPIRRLQSLGRLAVLIWKLAEIRRSYEALGVNPEIIADTFSDITLRQRLYLQNTGKVGLDRADCVWFRHLVNTQIFKLSVLQYQPTRMFYLEKHEDSSPFFVISDAQKAKLPVGTPVLNVHIQAGADLRQEQVAESLQAAREFFARIFPETHFRAMVCYSWLLHSGLQDLLPPNSRILRFAENFEMISETGDDRQAVERVFGKRYRNKTDYPQQTSLQKAAFRNLSKLGYALGIIYLD